MLQLRSFFLRKFVIDQGKNNADDPCVDNGIQSSDNDSAESPLSEVVTGIDGVDDFQELHPIGREEKVGDPCAQDK